MQSDKHHRHTIRLRNYDYSKPGLYFLTICAKNKETLFGVIENNDMQLNEYGKIVQEEWVKSSEIRNEIELDEYVIMPNHIHGIVIIKELNTNKHASVGAHGRAPLHRKSESISSFIAGFKSIVTKKINVLRNSIQLPVWQRNYYDHVIRNEDELNRIRKYIIENPLKWETDEENPLKISDFK